VARLELMLGHLSAFRMQEEKKEKAAPTKDGEGQNEIRNKSWCHD